MNKATLITGTPWKRVLTFSMPLMLGNLFQQFYSMADAFIISHILNVTAFAGVSSTHSFSFLIVGFAAGLTAGITIPVAQCLGAGDEEGVRRHYVQNLLICFGVSVLLTTTGLLLIRPGLHLLETPGELLPYATDYLQIIFAGIIFTCLYNYFANVLRALGDSRSPFLYLLIASAVNIVLDYALLRYTDLGVRGAAAATVLSQAVSAVLCFLKISRRFLPKALCLSAFRVDWKLIGRNMRLGAPMGLQSSMIALGVVFVQGAVNRMGTEAVTAYAAGGQIDGIGVEPMRSLGMAVSTYTAQNYGAGQYDRIRTGVRQSVRVCLIMAAVLCLVLCVLGRSIAAMFIGGEEELLDLAARYLRVHGLMYPFLALLFIWRFALQGMGNARIVLIGSLFELAARFSAAMLLIPAFDFTGACFETPASWVAALIPVAFVFWRTMNNMGHRAKQTA